MLALARGGSLVGLFFAAERRRPRLRRAWRAAPDTPLFRALARQLAEYLAGRRRAFDLPLDPAGTPFQSRVWAALAAIPYGEVRTYAALARQLGEGSPRAVGAAVGRNPLGIVIPCHRAVGADGGLTGYGGGLGRKRALLVLEGARPGTPRRRG
jgi:methylated-DNA-[protein]-cysteine S-methyltransferase